MSPGRPAVPAMSVFVVLGFMHLVFAGAFCLAQCSGTSSTVSTAGRGSAIGGERINLIVEVSDKSGLPISGLEAGDFKVFDNKHPEKILAFQAVDKAHPPAVEPTVQIIVDAMNSNPLVVARERDGLSAFLKQNGGKLDYPTSIWLLDDDGLTRVAGTSRDGATLLAALNSTQSFLRVINRSQGGWGASERTGQALRLVKEMASPESRTPGRKLVLFLSPGWPFLSDWEGADLNAMFHDIVTVSNGLRESCMSFYTLDPSSFGTSNSFAYENFLKGVTKAGDAQYPDLSLQVLSEHSGGEVIIGGNDIEAEINTALRGADTYYDLSFEAAAPHRGAQYHEIRVTVDKTHGKVRTTAGYYVVAP